MNDSLRPVGVIDSGVGGISVLKKAVEIMPNEDFIYYGDSLNAPYGTKSTEEIRDLTFAVTEKLRAMGIKALCVACNTATAAAIKDLRAVYTDMPVIGIEPAVKPAALSTKGGTIIVMATPMTIRQHKFNDLLKTYDKDARIIPLPCEGLMEMVENWSDDKTPLMEYFREKLGPVLQDDTETIVLGCTHYPFIKKELREFLGDRDIALIDGSEGTARQIKRRLAEEGLLRDCSHEGKVTILNSSEDPKMIDISRKLFDMEIDEL
jgi:glutamate racemase